MACGLGLENFGFESMIFYYCYVLIIVLYDIELLILYGTRPSLGSDTASD